MSRMLLVWSLLFGLGLVGADWYVERVMARGGAPATTEGQVKVMDDGIPIPPPN